MLKYGHCPPFLVLCKRLEIFLSRDTEFKCIHEEPHKATLLIILSDGCYAQFPVTILPPISCMLAGVRLAVIDNDPHRGDETFPNFANVC